MVDRGTQAVSDAPGASGTSARKTIEKAPFYLPVGDEQEIFRVAFSEGLPVLLKGPTGVGKTRFVEAMAHELGVELITVSCHDDLTAADLAGGLVCSRAESSRCSPSPGRSPAARNS